MSSSIQLVPKLPIAETFDATYLEYNHILPLELGPDQLIVAAAGPLDAEVIDDLEITYGARVQLVAVAPDDLRAAIRRVFSDAESMLELVHDLTRDEPERVGDVVLADARDLANQPPVIRFVNLLIREAHAARASDVHIEATRDGLRVRFRIDGVLVDVATPPRSLEAAVVSRVKLLADLDIAERRLPQDGRIRIRLEERELDVRVSCVPTLHGESLVLRLLDRGGQPVELGALGLSFDALHRFRAVIERPHGIVLATGPTGSGKTTTLYAALALRRASAEKIITVEDPIEYHLDGVAQVPVNIKAGMTFASALRSILRQDPDVLMIGEMRDPETAQIAVQAAMTGHLVFSTLHTNDALSAIVRMADLRVEPYLIASAVEAILAQRLVRRVCDTCRESYQPDAQAVAVVAGRPVGEVTLERGGGCDTCRGTGYFGRIGIFELYVLSEAVKWALTSGIQPEGLREAAIREGMVTLRQDGWSKVRAGMTTVEEVLRVTAH